MRNQLYAWLRAHPVWVDAVIAAPLMVVALAGAAATATGIAHFGLLLMLSIAQVLPLAWRRTRPGLVAIVVTAACLLQLVVVDDILIANLAVPFVIYTGSGYGRSVTRVGVLVAGAVGSVLGPLVWSQDQLYSADFPVLITWIVALLAIVATAWALGDAAASRRSQLTALEERAVALAAERDQQGVAAAAAERARIAREMHDVVAHSISVVVVQADGARYAAARNPDVAVDALETIAATARDALAQMRSLLGVLRDGDDEVLAPQPGIADVPVLVDQVRAAGLAVVLRVDGDALDRAAELSTGPQLAVYRVVQEALTNVMRHAGPAASATVALSEGATGLQLRVTDDGRGAAAAGDGGGHGLAGMAERMALHGGTVRCGPRAGGGFEVAADLPWPIDTARRVAS